MSARRLRSHWGTAGVVLVCGLVYAFVLRPATTELAALEQDIARQSDLLGWMSDVARRVRQDAPVDASASRRLPGESLLAAVERSARDASLVLERMEPEGEHGVAVWLEDVPFDDVAHWLGVAERTQAMQVFSASLERGSMAGHVSGRVVLMDAVSIDAAGAGR